MWRIGLGWGRAIFKSYPDVDTVTSTAVSLWTTRVEVSGGPGRWGWGWVSERGEAVSSEYVRRIVAACVRYRTLWGRPRSLRLPLWECAGTTRSDRPPLPCLNAPQRRSRHLRDASQHPECGGDDAPAPAPACRLPAACPLPPATALGARIRTCARPLDPSYSPCGLETALRRPAHAASPAPARASESACLAAPARCPK